MCHNSDLLYVYRLLQQQGQRRRTFTSSQVAGATGGGADASVKAAATAGIYAMTCVLCNFISPHTYPL